MIVCLDVNCSKARSRGMPVQVHNTDVQIVINVSAEVGYRGSVCDGWQVCTHA